MDRLCLSAALLVLLNILGAGAQRSDTMSPSQRRPVFCLEPPYKGPGKAVLPRFFFNTRSGLCEAFAFGGGRAKLNNFRTKDECTRVCSGRKPAFESEDKLELQAQPELQDEPGDETQDKMEETYLIQVPVCQSLGPEDEDKYEAQKPEDEDYDIEDDEDDEEDEEDDEDEDDED